MRRRDRWQGMPWIVWVENDTGGAAPPVPKEEGRTYAEAMECLVATHRRYVEIERSADAYTVRVLPHSRDAGPAEISAGLLYSGSNLGNILATAAHELTQIRTWQVIYRLSTREVARWVPS